MLRRSLPGELLRSLCGPQGTGEGGAAGERPLLAGGHGRGGTPGPVPNPEVKPPSADGTAEEVRGRAGRRRPTRGVFPLTQRGQGPRAPGRRAGAFFVCAWRILQVLSGSGRSPRLAWGSLGDGNRGSGFLLPAAEGGGCGGPPIFRWGELYLDVDSPRLCRRVQRSRPMSRIISRLGEWTT